MTKEANNIQDQIIDEFLIFEDWMDKYNYLIEVSNELPKIDEGRKTQDNLISGCQSNVWLEPEFKDGRDRKSVV